MLKHNNMKHGKLPVAKAFYAITAAVAIIILGACSMDDVKEIVGTQSSTASAPVSTTESTVQESGVNQAELEAAYKTFILENVKKIQAQGEKLTGIIDGLSKDPSKILKPDWITDMKGISSEIRKISDSIIAYEKNKIPEKYKDVHETAVSGCGDINKSADLMVEGVEKLDLKKLQEAAKYLTSGTEKFAKVVESLS